jgi:hypothetical protein
MPSTKAMFIQFQIDAEELRDNWATGMFSDDTGLKAQGQALYISTLEEEIRGMKVND